MPNEQTPAPMSKEEILKKHGIYPGFRSTYTYEAILSAMDEYRLAFEKEQQQSWMPTEEEWKQFPDAKWAAMDRDGWVFMHPDNPTCRTRFWIFGNGSCIPLKQVSPVNMDWTKCKVERPEMW